MPLKVRTQVGWETLPTYLPGAPDRNPMFLERRVYQGSSGRVYPLPVIDRIARSAMPRRWRCVCLENEHLRVMVLPELGGRVHALTDLATGEELIYRQPVIKPALVGLAGPWISGGIEFNWPQHHRPATFLPTDWHVEREPEGAVTVWCSDHDPLQRLRGMHGLRLVPGRACLELRVRVWNRTPWVQTFLWWANVAVRVHEAYQSFFPADVTRVADHARRATCSFPRCDGSYYGIDYGARSHRGIPEAQRPARFVPPGLPLGSAATMEYPPDDLSFYANIPVPTSYMAVGSRGDFFGGYDHRSGVGLVHVADHGISPGKKQWTWGNHEFGYAWDRNLTDPGPDGVCAPYIELMAGVFTDNQPDFSFLHPGESREWSQYWYPIHGIGPVQAANRDAALAFRRHGKGCELGLVVTRPVVQARIEVARGGRIHRRETADLVPGRPFRLACDVDDAAGTAREAWGVRVTTPAGEDLIVHGASGEGPSRAVAPAQAPPEPRRTRTVEELYLTGVHLEQYRHATRRPEDYWREALRRDPGDARCNQALGRWHLRRGEPQLAVPLLERAVQRWTRHNEHPPDTEAFQWLGHGLRLLGREEEAYEAYARAAWSVAWTAPASLSMAEMDMARGKWREACVHLGAVIERDARPDHAQGLLVLALRRLGEALRARSIAHELRERDPLGAWSRFCAGDVEGMDLQTRLDLAHDLARAGEDLEAVALLAAPRARGQDGGSDPRDLGAEPLVHYTRAWLWDRLGNREQAEASLRRARSVPVDHCFPARWEEIGVLEHAVRRGPRDARAPYLLGNLLYDRQRHAEAIRWWRRSARRDPGFPTVWRNLGMAVFNQDANTREARACYQRAVRRSPQDSRLIHERDQLWKRTAASPVRRWRELSKRRRQVAARDDLSLEWGHLLVHVGRVEEAREWLAACRFQPWEGGEGGALALHERVHLALGHAALRRGEFLAAHEAFSAALRVPESLGEARHPLANTARLEYALGLACHALRRSGEARLHWIRAAQRGPRSATRTPPVPNADTFTAALASGRLGRLGAKRRMLRALRAQARALRGGATDIDYFATSLPNLLLFSEDPRRRQETDADFLEALACLGLGRRREAFRLLERVLAVEPDHAGAVDVRRDWSTMR